MTRHYHVVENTPGYMPESNTAVFRNREAAVAYAAILARELMEDGYIVQGSDGDFCCERDAFDLGRVIKTMECNDTREECEEARGDYYGTREECEEAQ